MRSRSENPKDGAEEIRLFNIQARNLKKINDAHRGKELDRAAMKKEFTE